ncbi:hypothetical protein RJ640_030706 [Escallonia rubra]|uniref:Late embryogenesis abundant protein LEA-2 subgroup domain-containing protein n=1 Tax=Escallonia rubra TaxID=112253 RepID=A0AA88U4R5_9ASTE|nr:hypothetical protein RJ640_030706 [Escallonia rubra]
MGFISMTKKITCLPCLANVRFFAFERILLLEVLIKPSSSSSATKLNSSNPFFFTTSSPPPTATQSLNSHPMYRPHETNPHFLPLEPPEQPDQLPPQRQHDPLIQPQHYDPHTPIPTPSRQRPRSRLPPGLIPPPQFQVHDQNQPHQPQHDPDSHFPVQPQPQLDHQNQPPHYEPNLHFPTPSRPSGPRSQQPPSHSNQPPSSLRVPQIKKTRPFAWFVAVFCALFWIIIIVGGLIILIVYLIFRPRSPTFDISSATLNAAYLDMGYLLNADLTLLANFSNPNKKVRVDVRYMVVNLYFEGNLIASRFSDPFSVMRANSKITDVHMLTSQVPLSQQHSQMLARQMASGAVLLEIKGLFRTRSNLGSFLRYTYWLYGHCNILVGGPPSGVLLAKKCITKR